MIKLLGGLAEKAAGLNWYKYGIVAALLVAWTGFVHMRATNACQMAHQTARADAAEKRTLDVIAKIEARIPVVQYREVESAKDKAQIIALQGELFDAILSRKPNPNCDLSDAEFNGFRKLSEKTRRPDK